MPGISDETKRLVVWMMNRDRKKRPQSAAEIRSMLESKKKATSSSDDTMVLADDTEEVTGLTRPQQTPSQGVHPLSEVSYTSNDKATVPTQNLAQEEDSEFSFVGCFYLLIIIAIIVIVIKYLFLS